MKKIMILLIALLLIGVVAAQTVMRDVPNSPVSPGSDFTVTYTVSSGTGTKWGVSVEETVTGGCIPQFEQFVITSEAIANACTTPCSITYTAPASGTCTFTSASDYKFGTQSIVSFGVADTVSVEVTDCNSLKSTALSSIITWSGNPISTNKQAALNAIVDWASQC